MSTYTPKNVFDNSPPPNINVWARGDNRPSQATSSHEKDLKASSHTANGIPPGGPLPPRQHANSSVGAYQNGPLPHLLQGELLRSTRDDERAKDIANRIPRFYRIFDLINEQGSGGLVDKIIIAQDDLKRLINDLCPDAYVALTRVDFKALDSLSVRPIGIYGDRGEIIKFLSSLHVVDETTVQLLRHSKDDYSGPTLRSGIYIVRPPEQSTTLLYAIYWPQDTTWEDNAQSGPRRNRITFMRYLTKISDQILCLMSPAQSQAFIWDHQEEEEDSALEYMDVDNEDRLYTFEITKTNEQEETVVSGPGFRIESPLMQVQKGSHDENLVPPPPPRLMLGECSQGFLSVEALPPRIDRRVTHEAFRPIRLRELLRTSILRIQCELDDDAISALIKNGLDIGPYKEHGLNWQSRKKAIDMDMEKQRRGRMVESNQQLAAEHDDVAKIVMSHLVGLVLEKFPTIDPEYLSIDPQITSNEASEQKDKLVNLLKNIRAENILSSKPLKNFATKLTGLPADFLDQKHRVACVRVISVGYPQHADEATIRSIIKDGSPGKFERKNSTSWLPKIPFFSSGSTNDNSVDIKAEVEEFCKQLSDGEFLANLDDYVKQEPLVQPATRRASELAYDHFSSTLTRTFGSMLSTVLTMKREFAAGQVNQRCTADKKEALRSSNELFYQQINSTPEADAGSTPVVILERMNVVKDGRYETYDITARHQFRIKSTFQYRINKLEIPGDHRHTLQLDPTFIPQPSINQRGSITFTLPPHHRILHAQLVGADRVLFVVDQDEKFSLYLDDIYSISNALRNTHAKKSVDKRRIGSDILVAFDETKRLLVLCAPQKATLHVFMFDERFSTLQNWASPFELAAWYNNQEAITHICFMAGTEELLLVDSRTQARIYSFVSQRFRPASISLPAIPISVMSSPDTACALLVFEADNQRILAAYHWDSFGASDGTKTVLPVSHGSITVTSFVDRQRVHLMMLDETNGHCKSLVLTMTKKSSEFMFKEKGTKVSVDSVKGENYMNNCLIDCFADVWTRFPVVAAVSRHSITSSARQPKRITFVSDQVHEEYASYFADMIRTFEEQTKKPTDGQLRRTLIDAITFPAAIQNLTSVFVNTCSQFLAGQWFVNLLCLLPIHIAVARDNRFVPLKDGVSSADFERSLLGAEVGQIVDNLSFGWYESILRSYMADKPVRVVSSMGEQSVGKSFALNHLMDTSFAGSAMRTTEGVWMSITPTDDALLVALDFEGVHSIERSPQEDALLVLFNTAVSNLVLFRNNFAISRDIADLFQSFQASSAILDPTANPSLFQSTLVIIIKDVIESDKTEIVREFSSKFQRIVQAEQGANFITKLHAGRLNIIPWPVIESSQFYTLYSTLKRRLDSQKITHPSAGEFLHTLKILMAKLKANDWSAMSQSLAAHRVQTLLVILPVALQHGFSEAGSENEQLKNLDNDTVIDYPDTDLKLFLSSYSPESSSREAVLADLRSSWPKYDGRHDMDETVWMNDLSTYLSEVVKLRVAHVEAWISVNLQRFKSSNTNVELLQREMANAVVDLQANVDLCKMTCLSCRLSCTLSRRHDPSQQAHDCNTNHQCPHACDYPDDHPDELKTCQSPAGHDGPHICVVDLHLCGKSCVHHDKKGCQQDCTKMALHEGDHICSAREHFCGEPCALRVGVKYPCGGTCSFPSDEPHDQHVCDNRMCPMTCELCKRLCGNADHLHGLDAAAIHLCGEGHRCQALCTAGICEIDTTPQSIEATFTGRHETFQYTKYSQAAKRLPCVKPIPAGEREHQGQHIHSLDPAPFHFCETRCENCGYYCTLPRGHTQQEHETSHGSMSRTRWAVDGPDGAAMELNGRRFGANDEGAPMMCNLVCQSMGRHAHIDYCRTDESEHCAGPDHEHIPTRLAPNPDRPKDWLSHMLYWRRLGFRDPYSRDDQTNFAKCDSMCPGPEHAATANQPPLPSYCTLPLFHPPHAASQPAGLGYVSNDGHLFSCKNPVVMQQAFHVIFVIDRSGSMSLHTSTSLPSTPVTPTILHRHNNRLGAVYLSLHGFWQSRQTALTSAGSRAQSQAAPVRRDAYSVILFNHSVTRSFENDLQSTPENLLQSLLRHGADGDTNYETAVLETEAVMRRHWSGERSPVVIFLSDGECTIQDSTVRTLCRASISLGKPLSFHAVSFGPSNASLRHMAQIAREVESTAPRNPTLPANAHVESSYAEALDSVRLAETFLGIADSLKKTRGALMT